MVITQFEPPKHFRSRHLVLLLRWWW